MFCLFIGEFGIGGIGKAEFVNLPVEVVMRLPQNDIELVFQCQVMFRQQVGKVEIRVQDAFFLALSQLIAIVGITASRHFK